MLNLCQIKISCVDIIIAIEMEIIKFLHHTFSRWIIYTHTLCIYIQLYIYTNKVNCTYIYTHKLLHFIYKKLIYVYIHL